MQQPLVSIAILSFNRLEDLKETVKRTADISYPNLEIIIVDNGSKDGSAEFINSLDERKYNKIMLPGNLGSGYGRLQGMTASKGDFIISLDDDCFLRPTVVEKTVELFLANPNLGAIGYGYVNPYIDFDEKKYWKSTYFPVKADRYDACYDSLLALSGSAWRKSALEKVGYSEVHWFKLSDYRKTKGKGGSHKMLSAEIETDLCFNLFIHGYNTVVISELIAFHKMAPTNRNPDFITASAIVLIIRLILKYHPLKQIPSKLFYIINLSLYYTILHGKSLYLKAIFLSLKNSPKQIRSKKRLTENIVRLVKIHPIQNVFTWGDSDDMYVDARSDARLKGVNR